MHGKAQHEPTGRAASPTLTN